MKYNWAADEQAIGKIIELKHIRRKKRPRKIINLEGSRTGILQQPLFTKRFLFDSVFLIRSTGKSSNFMASGQFIIELDGK